MLSSLKLWLLSGFPFFHFNRKCLADGNASSPHATHHSTQITHPPTHRAHPPVAITPFRSVCVIYKKSVTRHFNKFDSSLHSFTEKFFRLPALTHHPPHSSLLSSSFPTGISPTRNCVFRTGFAMARPTGDESTLQFHISTAFAWWMCLGDDVRLKRSTTRRAKSSFRSFFVDLHTKIHPHDDDEYLLHWHIKSTPRPPHQIFSIFLFPLLILHLFLSQPLVIFPAHFSALNFSKVIFLCFPFPIAASHTIFKMPYKGQTKCQILSAVCAFFNKTMRWYSN